MATKAWISEKLNVPRPVIQYCKKFYDQKFKPHTVTVMEILRKIVRTTWHRFKVRFPPVPEVHRKVQRQTYSHYSTLEKVEGNSAFLITKKLFCIQVTSSLHTFYNKSYSVQPVSAFLPLLMSTPLQIRTPDMLDH